MQRLQADGAARTQLWKIAQSSLARGVPAGSQADSTPASSPPPCIRSAERRLARSEPEVFGSPNDPRTTLRRRIVTKIAAPTIAATSSTVAITPRTITLPRIASSCAGVSAGGAGGGTQVESCAGAPESSAMPPLSCTHVGAPPLTARSRETVQLTQPASHARPTWTRVFKGFGLCVSSSIEQ